MFKDGLPLLKERLARVPTAVGDTLASPLPDLSSIPPSAPVITCGLGSSEAAARLLVHTLGVSGRRSAAFAPLGSFFCGPVGPRGAVLVVFSQGLSPNARIALSHHAHYGKVVLVTSVTPEGLQRAGKHDRAAFLDLLLTAGAIPVHHPLDEEYTLLPRYVGPACVMIRTLQISAALGGEPYTPPADLVEVMSRTFETPDLGGRAIEDWVSSLLSGVDFNFAGALSNYAQNLSAKILESAYLRQPPCRDLLQFAHGPFQINQLRPREQWIFLSSDPAEQSLLDQVKPLFSHPAMHRVIRSPLQSPWDLFHHEAFLNRIVYEAVLRNELDLINWPGKGEDGPSYQLSQPFSHD